MKRQANGMEQVNPGHRTGGGMSSYSSVRGSEPSVRFCLSDILKVTPCLSLLLQEREEANLNIQKGLAQNGVENVRVILLL